MINARTLFRLAGAWLLALCAGLAQADPQVGWWWNPNESGRGFFIESQNGIFYLATYLYADDGRARWLVSGGPNADPNHWAGRLQEFHGGQTLFGPYALPSGPSDVGPIAVDFADDTHGTITWPGGVVQIERDMFGTPPANYQPESGWWWNPAESGSGYSIEVQGGNLFFVGFMYDAAGNPVWYFSAGPMTTPTTYTGTLQQFANGQTLTGAYRPPDAPANIGSLAVAFTAPDGATLTFTGLGAHSGDLATHDGQSRNITIQREFKPGPHKYDVPVSYTGSFAQFYQLEQSLPLDTISATALAIGAVKWSCVAGCENSHPPTPPGMFGQAYKYVPTGGKVTVVVTYKSVSVVANCFGTAREDFAFVDAGSALLITDLAQYTMQIAIDASNLQVPVEVTCIPPAGPSYTKKVIGAYNVHLVTSSPLFAQNVVMTGSVGPIDEGFGITRTGSWMLLSNPNGF